MFANCHAQPLLAGVGSLWPNSAALALVTAPSLCAHLPYDININIRVLVWCTTSSLAGAHTQTAAGVQSSQPQQGEAARAARLSPGSLLVTALHKASRHRRGQERCSNVISFR